MKKIVFLFGAVLLLASCKDKKMIVMSKGPAEVNTDNKTIKAKDGSGHEEKEVTLGGNDVVYKISAPAGETSVELKGGGLFIVNVKNDTVIGSLQRYGDPKLAQNMLTQDNMKRQIDSLQLLVEGKNVSEANHNFFILPNTAVKISENTNAMVVGPYHRMRSAEKVDGKDPEVYRFYSIKEVREMIGKLIVLTTPVKI
jgi:hypothetical protein